MRRIRSSAARRPVLALAILVLLSPALFPTVLAEDSFNVRLDIPPEYREVAAGGQVIATEKLFNLAGTNRMDVVVESWITDAEHQTLLLRKETVAVETQASLVRNFEIPKDARPGIYSLNVKVIYGEGKEALTSAGFEIEQGTGVMSVLWFAGGAAMLVGAVVLVWRSKPLLEAYRLKRKVRRIVRARRVQEKADAKAAAIRAA
jgi:hypothetical protein